MTPEILLKEVAEIKMGYLPRKKLEPGTGTGARLLQLRDVSLDGELDYSRAQSVTLDPDDLSRFLAQEGDVLLANRGTALRAANVLAPPLGTLVSAHFFILRPLSPTLRADYLACFLNQRQAQAYFAKNSAGTSLKMLNKQALEHLPVQIPSQEIQEKLAKLTELQHRHKKLTHELNNKMDARLSQIASQIISEKNL